MSKAMPNLMGCISPCLNCQNRRPACHGSCQSYNDFLTEYRRRKAERDKYKDCDAYVATLVKKRVDERIRKEKSRL